MLPLIALGLGIICALVSRILLFIAAVRISAGWAIGTLLPFGPTFFRWNYPEEAKSSMLFRYLTLPFFCFFLIEGPAMSVPQLKKVKTVTRDANFPRPGDTLYYGTEKNQSVDASSTVGREERLAASDKEMQRLQKWGEQLRLRKRDLLHSDVQGNRVYVVDLALYDQALAKATAERNAVDALPK